MIDLDEDTSDTPPETPRERWAYYYRQGYLQGRAGVLDEPPPDGPAARGYTEGWRKGHAHWRRGVRRHRLRPESVAWHLTHPLVLARTLLLTAAAVALWIILITPLVVWLGGGR
jgi:hypothetical protein